MNIHLGDEGLDELMAKAASMTPIEFNDYLDEVTGVKLSKELGDEDGVAANVLAHHPHLFREHLRSQDIEQLTIALKAGDVMDRVTACLRLLRIPPNLLPADMPVDVMTVAQHRLSEMLVQYPVLMHNRIFIAGHHFARAEYGPIATIIAKTPRAEFPRSAHGISGEKLRAFARHHCVLTGLTKAAPNPSGNKDADMQGKTMSAAFGAHMHLPKPRMLTSVLELDDHRASSFPASRRPASFLPYKNAHGGPLRTSIANTLLGAFNINTLTVDTRYDPTDFKKVLKTSGITKEAWFLRELEKNLYRWVKLSPAEIGPAFSGLATALKELRPYGLGPVDIEVQPRALMQWLVQAVLDSSSDRSIGIGASFKQFPNVDAERAVAVLAVIDRIGEESGEDPGVLQEMMERSLGGLLGDPPEVWRAALRVLRMRQVISDVDIKHAAAAAASAPAPERRSRAL